MLGFVFEFVEEASWLETTPTTPTTLSRFFLRKEKEEKEKGKEEKEEKEEEKEEDGPSYGDGYWKRKNLFFLSKGRVQKGRKL